MMIKSDDFISRYQGDYRKEKIGKIYSLYQRKLKENNALDFDDIINLTIDLLIENEDVLDYYSDKFKYILVDEYQDTNKSQFKLVSMLAKKNMNIMVVGDNDQGIYSFRGADISNILNFEKDYLTSGWAADKIFVVIAVILFFAFIIYTTWQRKWKLLVWVVVLGAVLKIIHSLIFGGKDGLSIVKPAVLGLAVCISAIIFMAIKKRKR